MIIMGIETSCDDTCVAVVKSRENKNGLPSFRILSNIVSSQVEIHRKWGGVYPSLAKREHQQNLPLVLSKSLKKIKKSKVDVIAVTVGPGLDPCLWIGINFAKEIASSLKIPLIPVNHIESHLIVSLFSSENDLLRPNKFPVFPAVGLIVSGGHTQIVLMRDIGKYKILGETRDDAAGECFDKTARILGLDYPGGPAIAAEAAKFSIFNNQFSIKLPRPMINQKNFDFSFSGLKTAVLYYHQSLPKKTREKPEYRSFMSHEIQQAIIDVLFQKTMSAAKETKARTIILGGGVVANRKLRYKFKQEEKLNDKIKILLPPAQAYTDNALMVAITGFFKKPASPEKIKSQPNLRI